MRILPLLLIAQILCAADRYVATTGTDIGTCTNIATPCASLEYADNQSAAGDTIYVRGGRYTTTAATFITPSVAATASQRVTVRSYPGELAVFDCENTSGKRFANFTTAGIGYYTFAGFKIENVHSSVGPFLIQGTHPGIEIKGVRATGAGFGIIVNPLADSGGLKVLGTYIENGLSTGFDCSSQSGANNGDYSGCNDAIIQDSVFSRTVGSGSDHVGMEGGRRVLFSRVSVETPTVDNDCLDLKANEITLEDVSVIGCTVKGATAWGYSRYRHVRTNGISWVLGEYTSRDIDGAVDDGGFIKITASYSPYGGQVPIAGQRVTIAGVVGCTGANGTWTIKDAVSKDVFRIMGDNGEGTSCGGAFVYDAGATVRLAPPSGGAFGADVQYSTFDVPGGTAVYMLYGLVGAIPWRLYDSIVSSPATSGSNGICASSAGVRSSDRNQFYTGRGQIYDLSYTTGTQCPTFEGNLMSTYEPASHHGHPNLDSATLRATASSPVTLVNRGYYSGWNSVMPGETRQILRWRAPSASDSCTANLYSDSSFSTLVESINSPAGHRWREVVFGSSTPLSPATTYYHWITCGYDAMNGSAATLSAIAGTSSHTIVLGSPNDAAQTQAAIDYSLDGSTWTNGTPAACSSGCTLTASSLERGQIYYIRTRRISAGGATLGTSAARAEVIP